MDSFFWSEATNNAPSVDFALIDNVGGCFEAVAEALALVRTMLDEHPGKPKGLERSLPLVAEAQSGLRAAFQRLGAAADPDQLEVFEWLKVTAARHSCLYQAIYAGRRSGGSGRLVWPAGPH